MNNYVISDIHGNVERFSKLMSVLNEKHPNKDYMLYVLGDLFDRGEDGEEVLSTIFDNAENVFVLKGNHEALFMDFMENPIENYVGWQMNYAYPTIISFGLKHLSILLDKYKNVTSQTLVNEYYKKLSGVERRLQRNFASAKGKSYPVLAYVNQMKMTVSSRDMRNVSVDLKYAITSALKKKSADFVRMFESFVYLNLVEDFCNLYEYFKTLPAYALVGDEYLLVHSGCVAKSANPRLRDNCSAYYNPCYTIDDLPYQNEYPMLWARRYDLVTEKNVPPQERFDGRIIVYGHTTTNSFNKDKSSQAVFANDYFGKLASVGLDGGNYNKIQGMLNCLCLEDLSQIIVKGSAITKNLEATFVPYDAVIPYNKENDTLCPFSK